MGGKGLGGGWGREGRWSPCFSRQFNNWELDEVESSFWKLQLVVIKKEVEDSLRWNESKCDKFSIKSLYSSLSTGFRECFPTLCGDLGYQWRSTSLHGKCHGVESLLFTGSKEGVGLSLIVVTCAKICGGDNRPLAFILFQSMNGVALDSCLLWSGVGYVSSLRGNLLG